MEVIYADTLVLLNGLIDYLLLLAAGKLCALPLRRWRLMLGALWGGVYSLLAALRPEVFSLLTVKLLAGAVATVIAFGTHRNTIRATAAFYAVSAAFAGAIYAAAGFSGQPLTNGVYLPVSLKTLLLSFAVCYAVIAVVFRYVGRRGAKRYPVTLSFDGKEVSFTAMEDSGNCLIDPITGNRVLVVEAAALLPLFPDAGSLLNGDPIQAMETLSAAGYRFRLLSCTRVAADTALLLCFRPDRVTVDGEPRRDITVAVSPNALTGDGTIQGILGLS